MTPNAMLQEFFARLAITLISLDWRKLSERQVDPILTAISWLPRADQERLESSLATIYELACETGWQAVLEMARQLGVQRQLLVPLQAACPYTRAVRIWLDHPELFEAAMLMHQVDGLVRWRKRTGLPLLTPRVTEESRRELAAALSACLQREEGRGQHCTVDYLRRRDGADVFVAYPDDFVQAVLEHDQEGHLAPRAFRPTFEIVYAYQAEHGTLEIFAQVPSRLKTTLENIFGHIILGADLSAHTHRRPWDLNRLKDRYFCLETDPQDELQASICRLRLDVPQYGRLTVEPERSGQATDVFAVIDECLNDDHVCWEHINISLATFRFQFAATRTRGAGTLTFDVSAPDHCSIRSRRPERIALTQKYLRRWRIAHV